MAKKQKSFPNNLGKQPEVSDPTGKANANPSRSCQLLDMAKVVLAILIIPIILLFFSGRFQYADIFGVIGLLVRNVASEALISNFLFEAQSLAIQLLAIIIGASLLFRMSGITQATLDKLSKRWYWKILKHLLTSKEEKRPWHIYSGYFLLLLILAPVLGLYLADVPQFEALLRQAKGLPDDAPLDYAEKNYAATVESLPMLTMVLLATRILSRIGVKILGTDIGLFVIAIFISESIFLASARNVPLEVMQNIANPGYPADAVSSGLVLYGYSFAGASIALFLDWVIVVKFMQWIDDRIKKTSKV